MSKNQVGRKLHAGVQLSSRGKIKDDILIAKHHQIIQPQNRKCRLGLSTPQTLQIWL